VEKITNSFTMKKDVQIVRKEFRSSADARYFHRLHGVLLVLNGLSTIAAGKLLGDPQRTVADWVKQFEQHGLDGLRDKEKSGRPSVLDSSQIKSLKIALKKRPQNFGLDGNAWTGALVCEFLKKTFGVSLTVRHSLRLLKACEE
jgi:transposase